MLTTYTVHYPDGITNRCCVDWPQEPGFEAIRKVVEPILESDLERVRFFQNGIYCDMFVDDKGHMKDLPTNDIATKLYRNNVIEHCPEQDPNALPNVVGVAVVFDRAVWF